MGIDKFQQFIDFVYNDIYHRDDFGYFGLNAEIIKGEHGYTIIETFTSWKHSERNKNIKVIIENEPDIDKLEAAFKTYILTNWNAYLTEKEFNKIKDKWT